MLEFQLKVKRIIDLLSSTIGLLILSPLFIIIAVIILKKLGRPIFFFQKRPGKNEEIFEIVKFRTMLNARDEEGNLLPNEERLTGFGRFLRSTSLDEIPELINVLKGEMSLVGPRPLRVEYLPLYNNHQKRRHEMKPGITGLAQINGRNNLTWEEKFDYDVQYIDNFNLFLDFKILLLTFVKVFKREGINKGENLTMNKFTGSGDSNGKQ